MGTAGREADGACFVELILEIIRDGLKEVMVLGRSTDQDNSLVARFLSVLRDEMLSAVVLMERLGLPHRATK